MLEKLNKISSKSQQKEKINHQSTKTNLQLNYDKEKVLILEMETENHEAKDKLIITPSGLIGSLRNKAYNSEDSIVYFGYKEQEEYIVNKYIITFLFFLIIIGWKNRLLFAYDSDKIYRIKRKK